MSLRLRQERVSRSGRRLSVRVAGIGMLALVGAFAARWSTAGEGPPQYLMQSPTVTVGGSSAGSGPALITVGQAAAGKMSNDEYSLSVGAVSVFVAHAPDCEGDANGDGNVDPLDAGYVLARFGCPVGTGDPGCDAADQNDDGHVDPLDSGFVLARFGTCQ